MTNQKERMLKFIPNNTIFVWYFLYLVLFLLGLQLIGLLSDYLTGN